jgi:hypothetical protein
VRVIPVTVAVDIGLVKPEAVKVITDEAATSFANPPVIVRVLVLKVQVGVLVNEDTAVQVACP